MASEDRTQSNRVDRSVNGAFCAFWHGQMAYENGRVKRFDRTAGLGISRLLRCGWQNHSLNSSRIGWRRL
jgi:hypothetical protein